MTVAQDNQEFCVKEVFHDLFFHFESVHALRYT